MKTIAILGAGISGLSLAYVLSNKIKQENLAYQLILIDKDVHIGGKIQSIQDAHYLYETSANAILNNKTTIIQLIHELGLDSEVILANEKSKRRFIFSNKKLHEIIPKPQSIIFNSLLSTSAKLRFISEIFIPRKKTQREESVAEFVTRRFGQEALDKLFTPATSGIYAGDPKQMSVAACFPILTELEQQYGSVIKGLIKSHKLSKGKPATLLSFNAGMNQLCARLLERFIANNGIFQHTSISKIEKLEQKFHIHNESTDIIQADILISSLPSYVNAQALKSINNKLSNQLAQISYAPIAIVWLSYYKKDITSDINGFGYLTDTSDSSGVIGSLWESEIFENRAPQEQILFRMMLGGARFKDIMKKTDLELTDIAKAHLAQSLDIHNTPIMSKVMRHDFAIPEYKLGHAKLINEIEQSLKTIDNLYLHGNAYYGVAVNDCITHSYKLAEQISLT